ncbi:MAG: type II toxin-antitoxin system VapC family toxin [Candidatus Limnocylindria bacterium]|nr:type II toxin-antitoxin system VapC family toxin [Candidatus Limnocylindria bacterium]
MPDLLLDTDVLVDNFRGARGLEVGRERAWYSVVTLCELFAGERVNEELVRITLSAFTEIAVDRTIAERAGQIRRASGIRTADALIAATAVLHHLEIVTRNRRDFERVDGLVLRDPSTLART